MKLKWILFTIFATTVQNNFNAQPEIQKYATSPLLTPTVRIESSTEYTDSHDTSYPVCPTNTPHQSPEYLPETPADNTPNIKPELGECKDFEHYLQMRINEINQNSHTLLTRFCNLMNIEPEQLRNQIDNSIYGNFVNFDWEEQEKNNGTNKETYEISSMLTRNDVHIRVSENTQSNDPKYCLMCHPRWLIFNHSLRQLTLDESNAAILYAMQFYKSNFDIYIDSMNKIIEGPAKKTVTFESDPALTGHAQKLLHQFKQYCITHAQLLALHSIETKRNHDIPTTKDVAFQTYSLQNPKLQRLFTFKQSDEPISPLKLPYSEFELVGQKRKRS